VSALDLDSSLPSLKIFSILPILSDQSCTGGVCETVGVETEAVAGSGKTEERAEGRGVFPPSPLTCSNLTSRSR